MLMSQGVFGKRVAVGDLVWLTTHLVEYTGIYLGTEGSRAVLDGRVPQIIWMLGAPGMMRIIVGDLTQGRIISRIDKALG